MNRRKFLKYAGATTAVVGASALGIDYVVSSRPSPVSGTTSSLKSTLQPTATILSQTTGSSRINHPPVARVHTPSHDLNPTDQQTIQFTNYSYDADNDPLTYAWYVDGIRVSEEKDYSTRLTIGDHIIRLDVSDGFAQESFQQSVTVDPDQIYPTKPLDIKYKGITFYAGDLTLAWPYGYPLTQDQMNEALETIHDELECNAIILSAGMYNEDDLIQCGQLAIAKEFDRIYIQPQYMSASIDETVERIGEFAARVRALREQSKAIVYCLGHEFGLETSGILPGDDWWDRSEYILHNPDWAARVNKGVPELFGSLMPVVKEKCANLPVTYAAATFEVELVPWENPAFESVCTDAYLMDAYGMNVDWVLNHLARLKQYQKPVNSSEAGCMTFSGAGYYGGGIPYNIWLNRAYDEDEQATYIKRYCDMLNRAKIDGYFYTNYRDPSLDKGYGLCNGKKRKKGFYMYKSYHRTS